VENNKFTLVKVVESDPLDPTTIAWKQRRTKANPPPITSTPVEHRVPTDLLGAAINSTDTQQTHHTSNRIASDQFKYTPTVHKIITLQNNLRKVHPTSKIFRLKVL